MLPFPTANAITIFASTVLMLAVGIANDSALVVMLAGAVLTGLAPPGALESAGAALGLAVGVGLDQLVRRAGGGERGADAAAPPAASLPAA